MNCFNKDILEDFIENELTEIESDRVISHISGCERCFEKIMNLFPLEKRLFDKLRFVDKKNASLKNKSACINGKLLLGYVIDGLESEDMERVENHIGECNACLVRMMKIQKSYINEVDLGLNFLKPVLEQVGAEDRAKEPSLIISMIENVGKKIYEVVECTGSILKGHFNLEASAVRGRVGIPERKEKDAIKIQKAFLNEEMSIEITITRGQEPHACNMKLSLMSLKGEGIVGIIRAAKTYIIGDNLSRKAETDKNGEIEFKNLPIGDYNIFIDSKLEVVFRVGQK